MKNQTGARKFDSILLAILIVLMCSQLTNLPALGEDMFKLKGFVAKQLFIAYCDVFLLLTFAWFCVRTTQLKAWSRLWWPPLACWALIAAMVIAAMHSPTIVNATLERLHQDHSLKGILKAFLSQDAKEAKEAIADILQFTMYFVIAPLVFVNLLHDRREGEVVSRRRLALHAFSGALLLTTFIAFVELLTGREEHGPNALFSSPNAYAAFLALALPLAIAHILSIWNKPLPPLIATLVTVALAALTLMSPWAILAIAIGTLTAGALLRQPARAMIVLGLLFVVTLGGWAMSSSLYPMRSDSLSIYARHEPRPAEKASNPGEESQPSEEEPKPGAAPDLKKQFIEWYAALGWSRPRLVGDNEESTEKTKSFATGVGPGNYQSNIGPYYGSLPNEAKMAPDSNNLYLVQGVALGVLGLGALFWAVLHFVGLARRARRQFPNDWLGAGVLASLLSAAFVNLFHALIVRGTGLLLAFVFSLAVIALIEGDSQHQTEESV